jgi:uncharacterized Zn-binding protein involved in type VI secretion
MASQPVARNGDSFLTGHGCTTVSVIVSLPTNVYVNGRPIATVGAPSAPHTILSGRNCVPHMAAVFTGSATVFADGRPVARVGDAIDAGAIITGSSDVYCG